MTMIHDQQVKAMSAKGIMRRRRYWGRVQDDLLAVLGVKQGRES